MTGPSPAVGDRLPEQRRSSDVLQSVRIAGATWNFHRIHWDGDYARSERLPGAIVNSGQLQAWLEALVEATYGVDAVWRSFALRFRAPVLLDAAVTCGGEVVGAAPQPGGQLVLDLSLWVRSVDGETIYADGQAVIEVGG